MKQKSNHLINETSPYLLQHAYNPVEWYPWNEAALQKAKEENKPIFLSIGYAACHWCHVMEYESFEDEETAALMNDLFVNIKVDREERPDLDQVYMKFVQMTTGSGGWPMSVFLTPEQKPFFGGTYFPPNDRYGKPGFKKLLQLVADFYHNKKDELAKNLAQVDAGFKNNMQESIPGEIPSRQDFIQAAEQLSRYYEPEYGGIGQAPKFPAVQGLNLFLRAYQETGQQRYLDMVTFTLTKMAHGGIYDQLAGGFARYSVDEKWFAPHFEKMLYDNGQLANLYLDTYLITKDKFYLKISNAILDFIANNMYSKEGGFYSAFDADSEGIEGLYYLWTKHEIEDLLGKKNSDVFCAYFGVTEAGNFEARNILFIEKSIPELAEQFHLSEQQVSKIIQDSKDILLKQRSKRIAPALDDKIIVSWNGLMLSAFARNYQVTQNEHYKKIIINNVEFIENNMLVNNQLMHTFKDGQAKYIAYLDDYANLIQALLDAYEALFNEAYLELAVHLTEQVNLQFWDKALKGYFYTSERQKELIHRLKDEADQSIPSGTGIMALNLLRLYSATEKQEWLSISEHIFQKYGTDYKSNPYGYASHLNALDFYLSKPFEILLVTPKGQNAEELLTSLREIYLPNKIILLKTKSQKNESVLSATIFQNREPVGGKVSAYVCRNFTCSLPVNSAQELLHLLQ